MYKIGLVGVQRTGKTTTLKALTKLLRSYDYRVNVVKEQAMEAIKYGYELNSDATPNAQLWIALSHMKAEVEAERGNPDFILTDRTAFDGIAYFKAFGLDHTYEWRIREMIRDYTPLKPYDLVLMYRLPKKDYTPTPDQIKVDKAFDYLRKQKYTYEVLGNYHRMEADTLKDRVQEAIDLVYRKFIR